MDKIPRIHIRGTCRVSHTHEIFDQVYFFWSDTHNLQIPFGCPKKVSLRQKKNIASRYDGIVVRGKKTSSCLAGVEVYELGRKRKELTPSLTPETCRFPFPFFFFFLGKKCAAMCALGENLAQ